MSAKILPFPMHYNPPASRQAVVPICRLPTWLRERPCPLDRVEVLLLRLDWAMRGRALRRRPTG